jgi:hypothetical protein
MLMKKSTLFMAIAANAMLAAAANAAFTLNISSAITQVTNAGATTGGSTSASVIAADLSSGAPHDYKVTYSLMISGSGDSTTGEVAFGNFDLNLALNGVNRSSLAAHSAYIAINPQINVNTNPTALYQTDTDGGTSNTDLQHILVAIPGGQTPNDASADDGVGNAYLEAVGPGVKQLFGAVWVTTTGGSAAGAITAAIAQWSTSNSIGGAKTVLAVTTDPTSTSGATQSFPGVAVTAPTVTLTAGAAPVGSPVITLTRTGNNSYLPGGATSGLGSATGDFQIAGLGPDSPLGVIPTVFAFAGTAGASGLQTDATSISGKYEANLAGLLADAPWVGALATPFNSGDQFILVNEAEPAGGGSLADLKYSGFSASVDQAAAVPEPTAISLAGIGAVLAMGRRRRQA